MASETALHYSAIERVAAGLRGSESCALKTRGEETRLETLHGFLRTLLRSGRSGTNRGTDATPQCNPMMEMRRSNSDME
jgi:hypothetical protein